MADEAKLIIQVPHGSSIDLYLKADPPAAIADVRVIVEHLAGGDDGRLLPPEAGEVVLTVPSPEALRREPGQVADAISAAAGDGPPLVVLVDRGTASSAEIVTGALKDRGRAKVVGTHTYGKGVFQEIQTVPGGGALDITVGEYFTPNGQNLGAPGVANGHSVAEGPGIAPNVYAPDNPAAPGDRALRAAERVVAAEVR